MGVSVFRVSLFAGWVLLAGMVPVGTIIWANWMIAPNECWSHIIDGRTVLPWLAWLWVSLQVGARGILD
jgi:hypothetical protein